MIFQNISDIKKQQEFFFRSGATRSWNFRKDRLKKLKNALISYKDDIVQAVYKDLRKSEFEIIASELLIVLEEINLFLKKTPSWEKIKKVSRTITTLDSQGEIHYHPYGNVLIISPWNYPVQLSLLPLVGAIATGNCVILKVSEIAPHTASILTKMIQDTFDTHYITMIEGEADVTQHLLDLSFDKIFFTGSPQVGKIVMGKAAEYLSSVTLELGGKSPVIIDQLPLDLLQKSLKRIIWGKFLNSGQTCIAPDYLLIHQNDEAVFKTIVQEVFSDYISERFKHPIINEKHYNRLKRYLGEGEVLVGGQFYDEELSLELTLIKPDNLESLIMTEEIFGPILPVLVYSTKEEAEKIIRKVCDCPLSLYVFTQNKNFEDFFINRLSFGGACINDTVSHVLVHNLPFGGVRSSGIGSYHGYASFKCFSRQVSVLKKGFVFELPFRYPPYNRGQKMLNFLFKKNSK